MSQGPTVTTDATPIPAPWLRLVRSLSPRRLLANLRNPIVQKEIFVLGRKRSTYVVRSASLLILLAIVILAYLPTFLLERTDETGLEFMQRVQELAPQLTAIVLWFEFVALVLVGPMILGGSLCDERRSGTLGALFTTPLTAFQIAAGKLIAGLSQLVILVLLAMPLLLALRIFGGVPLALVFAMAAVVLSTALLAATLSLFYSARSPRGFSAAMAAILATVAIHGVVSICLAIASAKGWMPSSTDEALATALSAPVTLGMSTAELMGEYVPMGLSPVSLCWYNTLYSLAVSAVAFLAVVIRLRRVMLKDAGSAVELMTRRQRRKKKKQSTDSPPPSANTESTTAPPDDAVESVRNASREVSDRPVLWRELAQPAFRSYVRLIFTALILAGLLIYVNAEMTSANDRHGANLPIMGIGLAIMLFIGTGAASGSIPLERESRTLDVLMTTPLSAREIIVGKFWGAMKRQWFIPAVLLTHLLLSGVLASDIPLVAIVHVAVIIFCSLSFLSALGIWMSIKGKKGSTASVKTALIALSLWLLPFPAFALIAGVLEAVGIHRAGQWFLAGAAVINPVFLGVDSLLPERVWDGGYTSGRYAYTLPLPGSDDHIGFVGFTTLLAIVMGTYLLLAKLILRRARVLLGQETNRLH